MALTGLPNRGSSDARARTAIVNYGNPIAWHGTSTTLARTNEAEVLVLDELLAALEFPFGLLADAFGVRDLSILPLALPS
jgi:hypothetical protein